MSQFENIAANLQIGDLVFIRISNFLYRRLADATQSWTCHVGMIDRREGTDWIVAESTIPWSRYCPLSRFLHRSEGGSVLHRPARVASSCARTSRGALGECAPQLSALAALGCGSG